MGEYLSFGEWLQGHGPIRHTSAEVMAIPQSWDDDNSKDQGRVKRIDEEPVKFQNVESSSSTVSREIVKSTYPERRTVGVSSSWGNEVLFS
jgi:hypothetical protein